MEPMRFPWISQLRCNSGKRGVHRLVAICGVQILNGFHGIMHLRVKVHFLSMDELANLIWMNLCMLQRFTLV